MADYSGYAGWDSALQQLYKNLPGFTQKNFSDYTSAIGSDTDQFASLFKNYVGRDPTTDEINKFLTQGVTQNYQGITNPGSAFNANPQQFLQNFIQGNFQQEANKQAQTQADTAFQGNLKKVQDLVNQQTQATTSDLLNPQGKTFQEFAGLMNNYGITPSSGAFQAGLGNAVGSAAAGNEAAALGQFGIPAISGEQAMASAPYQNNLQNLYPSMGQFNQGINDIYGFNLESVLASDLAGQSAPSGFEKGLGYASAGSNILGNLVKFGPSNLGTSYICMALIHHGLATESDLDLLHYKTIGAIWKKARAFWWYATHAKELVRIAELKGINWKSWRSWFLDDPISKPTALEAVEEYITAYESLCRYVGAMHLWDDRVRRVSFLDSLLFLPKVLTYPPFIRAAWKVFKMKQLFILDLPLSRVD